MTALLADATNLGLARMASSSKIFSHSKLLWIAEWHIRDETYQAALACLIDAIHAQPFTKVWGDGDTSSSDGQFFKAGGYGEARADYNAKYGSEPGVKFYTHLSDRYAPFRTKVIAANVSEAAHILDGLLHHECSLENRELTPTRPARSIRCLVYATSWGFGSRRAFAILPIADCYVADGRAVYTALNPMIGGTLDFRGISENWNETRRRAYPAACADQVW